MKRYRVVFFSFEHFDATGEFKCWTRDFKVRGRRDADRAASRLAAEKGWGIRDNAEEIEEGAPTVN